jgi:hypothetical protein
MAKRNFTGTQGIIFTVRWPTVLDFVHEHVVSSVKSLQLVSNSIQWFSCEGSERDLSLFERNTELVRNRNEYRHDSTNFTNVKAGALVSDRQELKARSPSSRLFNPYHKRWLRSNRIALSLTLYSQQRQFSHCFIAFLPACLTHHTC